MQAIRHRLIGFLLALLLPLHAHALIAMRISDISDITLPTWNIGDGALSGYTNICVYTSGLIPPGSYAITASSPSGFVLSSGANQLAYSLYWDDGGAGSLGGGLGTQMSNNVPLTGRLRGNFVIDNGCALTGPNARLNITITQAAMTAALAGTYTGTVTLLVSPN